MNGETFTESLARGAAAEAELDRYFAAFYRIERASYEDQRHGIDRIFTSARAGIVYTIEYKADWRGADTGNCFIETSSRDMAAGSVPGWPYTSRAQILIHYSTWSRLARAIPMIDLKANLEKWRALYGATPARVPTQGNRAAYTGGGFAVPLSVLDTITKHFYTLPVPVEAAPASP
jgi:hypothetical protein